MIHLSDILILLGAIYSLAVLLGWDGPYLRIITRENNELYLERWSLRQQTDKNQDGAYRAFIHRFYLPDEDGPHNHPWRWSFSIVLWGSYEEEYFEPCEFCERYNEDPICHLRTRVVRWFNWITANKYHRVTKLNGKVTTLFITGPATGNSWGFWMPGRGHILWKQRLTERGYRIDCDKPPEGWKCSRAWGHEGPCAAYSAEEP